MWDCKWNDSDVSYSEFVTIVNSYHPDDTTTYNSSYELGIALSSDVKTVLEQAYYNLQQRWNE